jgi:DNA-binding GntR family transcriptional regulator
VATGRLDVETGVEQAGGGGAPDAVAAFSGSGQASIALVHDELRRRILHGQLPPGAVLSQAQLAREFGVSRSPVREACRLLEREGLVEARHNYRIRVADFSIDDLEEMYASRIVLETLAVRIKIPTLSSADMSEMGKSLELMRESAQERDYDRFETPHNRFHGFLVRDGGYRIYEQIQQLIDHTQRYRRVYMTQTPVSWDVVIQQDTNILEAIASGDVTSAIEELARHLATTALTTIALVDPSHDPLLVRTAVYHVCRAQGA